MDLQNKNWQGAMKVKIFKEAKKLSEIFLGLSFAIMNPTKSTPVSQACCNISISHIPQIFNFIFWD